MIDNPIDIFRYRAKTWDMQGSDTFSINYLLHLSDNSLVGLFRAWAVDNKKARYVHEFEQGDRKGFYIWVDNHPIGRS